jgi:cysteinyl-tRNA synthetase
MQQITLFNTKSREKEVFSAIKEDHVSIYHCGPTVYHFQHIGNMRRFIFADLVHRLFEINDYSVKQVINLTDVGHLVDDRDDTEDKMEKGAKREGKTPQEIAEMYTKDFMEDLTLLNISTDDTIFPKATENIPEQIALISLLEERGFTYQTSDGIYFDTSKDEFYADFARLDIEGMKEGARIEKNSEKKSLTDFALWKFSPKDEQRQQEWPSPWGIGFPGWHIECSAMVKKFLGTTIDVHTGGIEHIPIHHTNEIAQSENANEAPLARYWMHNEHLNFGSGKMAKSGESFIRLKDLIEKGYHPLAYRYFTLLAHYRSKINFSFEGLDAAAVAWKRLNEFVARTKLQDGAHQASIVSEVLATGRVAFNDDLDTPKIVALIWETMKNPSLSEHDKMGTIMQLDEMLGIIDPSYQLSEQLTLTSLPQDIQSLIEERQNARAAKDWNKADELRALLKEKGYEIKDGPDGIIVARA